MAARHTKKGQELTDLILETFRLNGALLSAGDELVRGAGLTSARWQVVGAIALAAHPLTVSQIGRRMGLSRQAVQRLVNELESSGLVAFRENPDHKRAKLVALTERGELAFSQADERQIQWSNKLAEDVGYEDLKITLGVLRSLNERLQSQRTDEDV